jgi:DNA adenine methylase
MVELDEQVARFWMVVLSPRAAALAERVVGLELVEQSVRRELEHTDGDDVDRAFRFLLRNRVSRAGLTTKGSGLLRHGEDGKGLLSRWYPSTLASRIVTASALREQLTVEHGDGLEAVKRHSRDERVAFFVDAPYSTNGASSPGARLYRHAELDHAHLFGLVGDIAGDRTVQQIADLFGVPRTTVYGHLDAASKSRRPTNPQTTASGITDPENRT